MSSDIVRNTEMLSDVVGRWYAPDIAIVQDIRLGASKDRACTLACILERRDRARPGEGWPSRTGQKYRVEIHCSGVTEFQTRFVGPLPAQVMGFDIVQCRATKKGAIEIIDYENDRLYIRCQSVEIVSVERM